MKRRGGQKSEKRERMKPEVQEGIGEKDEGDRGRYGERGKKDWERKEEEKR